jgi:hypothetical protein
MVVHAFLAKRSPPDAKSDSATAARIRTAVADPLPGGSDPRISNPAEMAPRPFPRTEDTRRVAGIHPDNPHRQAGRRRVSPDPG